jgi:hypothetical protein
LSVILGYSFLESGNLNARKSRITPAARRADGVAVA